MTLSEEDLKAAIKEEEGCELSAYMDPLGNLTIGYGHFMNRGSKIPQEAAEIIFESDYEQAVKDYARLGLTLDNTRRAALIDMIFNLGYGGVMQFRKMLNHLKRGQWQPAAVELMNSLYARQLPGRAKRNRDKILFGDKGGQV